MVSLRRPFYREKPARAQGGTLKRIDWIGRLVVPVVFILMLPVAFAASVKNEDHVDNSFAFAYDGATSDIVAATSSKRYDFDDDVDFSVTVTESDDATNPLVGRVKFRLLARDPVRYDGTIHFKVVGPGGTVAHSEDRSVSFTLERKRGRRAHAELFPFDIDSGDYKIGVTFSR